MMYIKRVLEPIAVMNSHLIVKIRAFHLKEKLLIRENFVANQKLGCDLSYLDDLYGLGCSAFIYFSSSRKLVRVLFWIFWGC
jgi:hypothetical protein